jgi:hypothetical protein
VYPAHIISCLKPTTAPKLTILHQTYNCSLLHQTHNGTEAHYTAPRLNVLATSSAASNLQLLRSSLYCTKAQCPCNCYASWSGRCSMRYLELMSYLINVVCSLLYIPQCPCNCYASWSGRCSMSYLELMSYLINVVCSLLYIPQCPCNCYASWSGHCSMSHLESMSYLINVVCSLLYIPQCPCHSKSLQQSGRTVIRNRTSNSTLANWLLFLN